MPAMLLSSNLAMENDPFPDDLPSEKVSFPRVFPDGFGPCLGAACGEVVLELGSMALEVLLGVLGIPC